jgi:hypothetical protein
MREIEQPVERYLVLLRNKRLRGEYIRLGAEQHGHRGSVWTMLVMIRRRMAATEFGICRSGRKGGAPGSVTVEYGKLPEQRGATRS